MDPQILTMIGIGSTAAGYQLSKPLAKLLKTVGPAIGIAYEPVRIRRKGRAEADAIRLKSDAKSAAIRKEAEAKADALVILARGKGEAAEQAQRAALRIANDAVRQQQNSEEIVRQAAGFLPTKVSTKPVDKDWIVQFFGHSQDVSNTQMQSIWSQILAGEIASPGTFSLRTLGVVKTLRPEDASKFTAYCQFVWSSYNQELMFVIAATMKNNFFSRQVVEQLEATYEANGIGGLDRVHLESLNLIKLSADGVIAIYPKHGRVTLKYFDKEHYLRHNDPERNFEVEADLLTDIGRELAPIAGARPNPEFETMVLRSPPGGFHLES
jgi:hypothetical protein